MFLVNRGGQNICAFYHIPKTGGVWVRERIKRTHKLTISRVGSKHAADDCVAPDVPRFCFVRHPVDWYTSFWRWCMDNPRSIVQRDATKSAEHHGSPTLEGMICLAVEFNHERNFTEIYPFDQFISNAIENRGALSRYYRTFELVCNRPKDFIGRFEYLASDLMRFFESLGVDLDPDSPPTNASQTPVPEWDKRLRRKLVESEKPIFERYGYT